jgi:hypothetical protein
MAREKALADDVIPLLEGLTIGDLEKVIAAAERQREAKRETGKRELWRNSGPGRRHWGCR